MAQTAGSERLHDRPGLLGLELRQIALMVATWLAFAALAIQVF